MVVMEELMTDDLIKEADAITRAHWGEINQLNLPYDPDWPRYKLMNELGAIRCFVARYEGAVVGYSTYFLSTHMHNKNTIMAIQDTLFLHPAHRIGSAGVRLVMMAEHELKKSGVDLIVQTVTDAYDIGAIFDRLGYESLERSVAKYLM